MSVAATAPRASGSIELVGRLFDPGGGRSLDDLVSDAWQGMSRSGAHSSCLVCGHEMEWNGDQRCADCDGCGASLS